MPHFEIPRMVITVASGQSLMDKIIFSGTPRRDELDFAYRITETFIEKAISIKASNETGSYSRFLS